MSADAMQTNFGVKPHEAARSGGTLRTYKPSGGLKSASVYGVYTYSFNQAVLIHYRLSWGWLFSKMLFTTTVIKAILAKSSAAVKAPTTL